MKNLLLAAAFLAATACADSTGPSRLAAAAPRNDTDVNETEPSALVTVNPCNGDVVALTGTLHILLHTTEATSGGQHYYLDFTSNYAGTGVPSMANYQGSTRTLNDFSTNDPFPIISNFYQDVQLQSATSADNYTLSIHFKLTINANGVPTATVENYSTKCTG